MNRKTPKGESTHAAAERGAVEGVLVVGLIICAAAMGCEEPIPTTPDGGQEQPVILEFSAPSPALQGSALGVRGLGFELLGATPTLTLEVGGTPLPPLSMLPHDVPGELLFELSAATIDQLGEGEHSIRMALEGAGVRSISFNAAMSVAESLPVTLLEVPRGGVHRNEVAVLIGGGVISAREGTLNAHFEGTFTLDSGGTSPLSVEAPVTPFERTARDRGITILTTDLGGMMPGTFEGTIQLRSVLEGGSRSESDAVATSFHFDPPELYSLSPTEASVGRILTIGGAGFLGGLDRPTEVTLIELSGMFTPDGEDPQAFSPTDVVPRFISGSEIQLLVEPEIRREQLVSNLFGYARGRFEGTGAPVTIMGTEELRGAAIPFAFTLGPVVQVVYLRFLPGFFASLTHFGLANAAPEVEETVLERVQGIFADWNVDIRLEEPDDYVRSAFSVLEIGGSDPNGVGLFGYDNTPGKDIGNIRLFDQIGGSNAQTQMDGSRGYGGVFVESFLYWSEHPDLPGERPFGAPAPDPIFDETFDPVREILASRAEAQGQGEPGRVSAVALAVRRLGWIIGETSSHELGHSLGMAQPYGAPNAFHNDFDGDGCLMDSGGNRPLGERMEVDGFAHTQLCYDHGDYLGEILGR